MGMSKGSLPNHIHFDIAEPDEMRYDTVSDWVFTQADDGVHLNITIVDTGRDYTNYLLQTHEVVEAILCRMAGITGEEVDSFDRMFEAEREEGDFISEPGDDPRAPYHNQHTLAELVERMIAMYFSMSWGTYMDIIEMVFKDVVTKRRAAGLPK